MTRGERYLALLGEIVRTGPGALPALMDELDAAWDALSPAEAQAVEALIAERAAACRVAARGSPESEDPSHGG